MSRPIAKKASRKPYLTATLERVEYWGTFQYPNRSLKAKPEEPRDAPSHPQCPIIFPSRYRCPLQQSPLYSRSSRVRNVAFDTYWQNPCNALLRTLDPDTTLLRVRHARSWWNGHLHRKCPRIFFSSEGRDTRRHHSRRRALCGRNRPAAPRSGRGGSRSARKCRPHHQCG